MRYRSSKSRITKQQQESDQLNDRILAYINSIAEEGDAETIWLGLRAEGSSLSQSSFNNRLKKMVEAGMVTKRPVGYNRNLYSAVNQ